MKTGYKITGTVLKAIFIISILSSCQKEITSDIVSSDSTSGTGITPTPSTTTSKVKTYSEYASSGSSAVSLIDSFNLSYDASNRLVSLVSALNSGNKFVYTYNSSNTYTLDIYAANVVSIHETFFINSISLVDSSLQINDTHDTTTQKYTYNTLKQLASLKEYFFVRGTPNITTTNYTYDNSGNALTETSVNPSSTTTYTYYPTLVNDVSIGEVYFYLNKNLTKTTAYTSGGTTTTAQHSYTFDSSNRQTSEKIVGDNGDTVIRKYTY